MPSPKLKFHRLPDGYRESTDNDVQLREGDELIPIVDKEVILANAVDLVGVKEVSQVTAWPINTAASRVVETMTPANNVLQNGSTAITNMVNTPDPSGAYSIFVLRPDNSVVPRSEYSITNSGIQFVNAPTEARKISYFVKAATPRTTWALPYQKSYNGTNNSFNKVKVVVNGGAPILITPSGTNREYITTASATTVTVSYWYESTVSRQFIGPHPNWLVEHMNTWPDVFVGDYDYPGDSGEINGTPVTQDEVPKYREPGTYTPSYRDGLITFPEDIDSDVLPVRANFAYLSNTYNVTSQVLDVVGGTSNKSFKASSEAVFPETHNKPIITRANIYMPFNVYVDGVLTPTRINVTPYETLTIKTGP